MIDHPFTDFHFIEAQALSGGSMGSVWRMIDKNHHRYICKSYGGKNASDIIEKEAYMLNFLKKNQIPTAEVIAYKNNFLLLEDCGVSEPLNKYSQKNLAEIALKMHDISNASFGFSMDTNIGRLKQPNEQTENWVEFFYTHRLKYITDILYKEEKIFPDLYKRLHLFYEDLEKYLPQNPKISLLHGDLWVGNIIAQGSQVKALIDPALFFGHFEQDLAYSTLFHTTDQNFFKAYQASQMIEPEFFECRKDIYNLWPLLCHAYWFGYSYLRDVAHILSRFSNLKSL